VYGLVFEMLTRGLLTSRKDAASATNGKRSKSSRKTKHMTRWRMLRRQRIQRRNPTTGDPNEERRARRRGLVLAGPTDAAIAEISRHEGVGLPEGAINRNCSRDFVEALGTLILRQYPRDSNIHVL